MSDYSREGLGGGSRERPSVDEGSSARKSPRLEDEPLPSCEFFSLLLLKKSLKHIFFAHLFEGAQCGFFCHFGPFPLPHYSITPLLLFLTISFNLL